jgi:hypothetical protein
MKMTRKPVIHQQSIILTITITGLLFTGYSVNARAQQRQRAQAEAQTQVPAQAKTQQPAPATQGSKQAQKEVNPCRFAADSPACFNSKIESLNAIVNSLESKLIQLEQTRNQAPPSPGPRIPDLPPQEKDKADSIGNLQKQIDALYVSVKQIIERLNR